MNRKRRQFGGSTYRPQHHNDDNNDNFNYSSSFNEPNENPLISGYTRQAPIDMEIAKDSMEGKRGKRRKQAFLDETFGAAIQTPGYQNQIVSSMNRTAVPDNQDYHKTGKWELSFTNYLQFTSIVLHLHLKVDPVKEGLALNAARHKINPAIGFLNRYIKSIRILLKGANVPINDNGRELYVGKFPTYSILASRTHILSTEHIKFPVAQNNNDRGKRTFTPAASADNAWSIDDVDGRDEVETKLFSNDGIHWYIKLSDLDLFGNCDQFFNNNHRFQIEIDFNDDSREYLTLSGKRAAWSTNAAGDERLVQLKHLSPPEIKYKTLS